MSKNCRYTEEYIQEYVNSLDGYELLKVFNNERDGKRYMTVKHKCGKISTFRLDKFLVRNQRCSCETKKIKRIKLTHDEYVQKLNDFFGENEYIALDKYIDSKTPIRIQHKCGYIITLKRPNDIFKPDGGGRCPICCTKTINLTQEIIDLKLEKYNANVKMLEPYKKNKKVYLFQNTICGHKYKLNVVRLLHSLENGINHYCPICSLNQKSRAEIDMFKYVKSIDKTTIENYRDKNKEIDIYVKDKKIGFEFDGLYWHSDKFKSNNKYHLEKTNFFKDRGIKVIHIFEDEWEQKNDIVKDFINYSLGNIQNKIYARNCKIKEVSIDDKNIFLEKNHLNGKDCSSIHNIGLYYNDELVYIMTLCSPRFKDKNNSIEISRFCSKLGTIVIGGFSKLINYIKHEYNVSKIIAYGDKRFMAEDKNIFISNGFKNIGCSRPDFYYCNKNFSKRELRYKYAKCRLEHIFPNTYNKNKTEKEIMLEENFHRIYDCGHICFELNF